MMRFTITRILAAMALALCASAPAFAQDYDYGPRDRYRDDLQRPAELDGLALGREAPFFSSEDLGVVPRGPQQTFEIEGPPIGPSLPVLPGYER